MSVPVHLRLSRTQFAAILVTGLVAALSLLWYAKSGSVSTTVPLLADALVVKAIEQDESVGPFASWTDLRAIYRARGDGAADDTVAIQRALDELGRDGRSPVLYIPRGTYRITATLSLKFAANLSIVGEAPSTTTLLWAGDSGGTMLSLNGIAYSRFARLTFDGAGKAGVAVEQSWDNSRPSFDTGNEYSETYFVDADHGIRGGFKGFGFAETTVRRARFIRNTKAGISLGNFNALDLWVWDSSFEDCGAGVTNTTGAGNFHVYNSLFRRSTVADLSMGNTGGFSARGNFSVGSKMFFSSSFTGNPAVIHIQGNTVIDPVDSTALRFGNQGPGLLTDNVIRSLAAAKAPVVVWQSIPGADVTSIGNTFTVSEPVTSNGRLTAVDDRVVPRATVNATVPVQLEPWSNRGRQVFEVLAGADAATIQKVIVAAARLSGQRPIVHFPAGLYRVGQTLIVPAGDLQLVGDGYGTVLRWSGQGRGPVLHVQGPGKTTFREIQVDGASKADGIVFETLDQKGSRVYMDGVQLRSGTNTNLTVSGLEHTTVQIENIGFAYAPEAVSIQVTGGPSSTVANRTAAGKTNIFSGASSGNRISFDVAGGARVLVRDLWYESGAGPGFARIHDAATFTLDGSRVSSPRNGVPAVDIDNLSGRVAVLSTHMDDRIQLTGNGAQAEVLALGLFVESSASDYFVDTTSPRALSGLINSRQLSGFPGPRSVETTNAGNPDGSFVRTMLAHGRSEKPTPLVDLPTGVSDVRLFRVWVANGVNNIILYAGRAAAPLGR